MDAFEFDNNNNNNNDNYSNSTPRFQCLPKIKLLFRIIEILAVLIFLTSATTRLPFAVEYFRRFLNVVVSPLFIFLLSNVIALTLFLKSRNHFPDQHSQISLESHLQFRHENGDNLQETWSEPVFQDKQTIVEVKKVNNGRSDSSKVLEEGEVEELSNEEFQRAIEDFIAKQLKFHQLEEQVDINMPQLM